MREIFEEYAYGRIVASACAEGKSILIAAIAQIGGFTAFTRDTVSFDAAGVPVINPWLL